MKAGRLEGWKVGRLEGWKVGRLEGSSNLKRFCHIPCFQTLPLVTIMMTMITYALADDLAELWLVDSAVDLQQLEQEGGPLVVAAA